MVVVVGILSLHAGYGLHDTFDRATRRVEGERARHERWECLEAQMDALVPPGASVFVPPHEIWWAPQRLVEWSTPERTVVPDEASADVVVRIAIVTGGCEGLSVLAAPATT